MNSDIDYDKLIMENLPGQVFDSNSLNRRIRHNRTPESPSLPNWTPNTGVHHGQDILVDQSLTKSNVPRTGGGYRKRHEPSVRESDANQRPDLSGSKVRFRKRETVLTALGCDGETTLSFVHTPRDEKIQFFKDLASGRPKTVPSKTLSTLEGPMRANPVLDGSGECCSPISFCDSDSDHESIHLNRRKKSHVPSGLETTGSSNKLLFSIKNPEREKLQKPRIKYSWQKSIGKFLAFWTEKNPTVVYIYNQSGLIAQEFTMKGHCLEMEWDPEGRFLALISSGSSDIVFWDSEEDRADEIDSKFEDIGGCLAWTHSGKTIAYATSKGNLFTFDLISRCFARIVGVHSCEIICAIWSKGGTLALATSDNILSLNNEEDKTKQTVKLPGRPSDIKFGQMNSGSCKPEVENALGAIINFETIYLLKIEEDLAAYQFGFKTEYGSILTYQWHPNDCLLVSFSAGYFISMSTQPDKIGAELFITKLASEAICSSMDSVTSKVAVCYKDKFEIREGLNAEKINIEEDVNCSCVPISCALNENGQLLAVLTKCADVEVYIIGVPLLGHSMAKNIVHLTSYDKLLVHQFQNNLKLRTERVLKLEIQPSIISVGPLNLCVVIDKLVWFYSFSDVVQHKLEKPCIVREYNSRVHEIRLNKMYAGCRCGNKLFLHLITEDGPQEDFKYFPGNRSEGLSQVTCFALTDELLIFGGNDGMVRIFELATEIESHAVTTNFPARISSIIPDATESRLIIVDEHNNGFIYQMVNEINIPISDFPNKFDGILWDTEKASKHMFITYSLDSRYVNIFVFWYDMASGHKVYKAGEFKAFESPDLLPLCLVNSVIYSQTKSGSLVESWSISETQPEDLDPVCGALAKFDRLVVLKKFSTAAKFCYECGITEFWGKLAVAALVNCDFDTAIDSYLKQGEVGIAIDLCSMSKIEDVELFLGHISVIFGKFKRAEKHYLKSSDTSAAVRLRIYLQQWDDAFRLAKQYSPDLICLISKEYAISEESRGNYVNALRLFDEVMQHANIKNLDFLPACAAGLARNCIRCEQIDRGMAYTQVLGNMKDIMNIADVLIAKNYYAQAADLYESCNDWNRAASLYIIQKDWVKFDATISKITTSDIFRQYAHAKELDGDLIDGAFAFERIGDFPNACRVFLKANQPDEAIRLAKMSENFEAVKTVCNFFLERDDVGTALRFLVMSGHFAEAVSIALTHDRTDLYMSTLLEFSAKTTPVRVNQLYRRSVELIADFCNELGQGVRAARYFLLSANPIAAFDCLLQTARNGCIPCQVDFLCLMIEVAQSLRNPGVTEIIRDYYSGRLDGKKKDPRLVLKFALQMENWKDAAEASITVARKEQTAGNYLSAHCTLFRTAMELKYKWMNIPKENMQALGILHIYMLSRIHISRGNINTSARLLARLSDHFDEFPAHVVELLTSTTIQCMKARLKETGMNACYKAMYPENRSRIDPKYKAKFEWLLRKYSKATLSDLADELTLCPFCHTMLENFQLSCKSCNTLVPFCIATGRHVTPEDLTCCPACKFPAIYSEFTKFLRDDQFSICPMCDAHLNADDLELIQNPDKFLVAFLPESYGRPQRPVTRIAYDRSSDPDLESCIDENQFEINEDEEAFEQEIYDAILSSPGVLRPPSGPVEVENENYSYFDTTVWP